MRAGPGLGERRRDCPRDRLEDRWLFAKTYFDRLGSHAADEIEPRWVDRLGGVRVFPHDHCAAMLMATAHDRAWRQGGSDAARLAFPQQHGCQPAAADGR